MQMGVNVGAFNIDWSVNEECKEMHMLPHMSKGIMYPYIPVCSCNLFYIPNIYHHNTYLTLTSSATLFKMYQWQPTEVFQKVMVDANFDPKKYDIKSMRSGLVTQI